MIKRTITETVFEYDKQGNVIKKIITETHEEENNTTLTYPSATNPFVDIKYTAGVESNCISSTSTENTKITI